MLAGVRTVISVSVQTFEDPGAEAVDDPQDDLRITSHLFLAGEANFRTVTRSRVRIPRDRPTLPDRPWLIRYSVSERDLWPWREQATPQIREVAVVCPSEESVCQSDDGGTFCSTLGFCIEFTDSAITDPNARRTFPDLKLLGGSDTVILDAGTVYAPCSEDESDNDSNVPCDEGVVALDTIDTSEGNVEFDISDRIIMRCAFISIGSGQEEPNFGQAIDYSRGLSACGFTTQRAGTWFIRFEVTNTAGFTSDTEKRIQINQVCEEGEVRCVQGVCVETASQCSLFGGVENNDEEDEEVQVQNEEEEEAERPWIGLREVEGPGGGTGLDVIIPEGLEYKGCNEESRAETCEPGADALDGTGSISHRVWACPQSPLMPGGNCLANPERCPFDEYGFEVAGLSFCQFDVPEGQEEFREGDSFEIQFAAMGMNGRISQIRRAVTVGSRCPSAARPHWCNAPRLGRPEFRCVALECDLWRALNAPDAAGRNDAPGFGAAVDAEGSDEEDAAFIVSSPDPAGVPEIPIENEDQGQAQNDRRRLLSRDLLQGGGGEDTIPTSTSVVNLIFGFSARSTPEGVAWQNPRLAPCQPGDNRDTCGTAAFDATGALLRLSTSTPCTDRFSNIADWEDYLDAVRRVRDLAPAGDGCRADLCSPTAADRGQCSPGRYIIRFGAVDTNNRQSTLNIVTRVENGARHRLQLLAALACPDGPNTLEIRLNSGRTVLHGLPYLKALGLDLRTVRRVILMGGRVQVDNTPIHPGIGLMPRLCRVSFLLELQVGCTPEEPGFKSGPSIEETESQWCPCEVDLNPTFKERNFQLDTSRGYPIVNDHDGIPTYGPIISYGLRTPTGAIEGGPSGFCSAITPSADGTLTRLRVGGAALSELEDAANTLLALTERLSRSIESILDNQHNETDSRIEAQWRRLLTLFTSVQRDRIDTLTTIEQRLRVIAASTTAESILSRTDVFTSNMGGDISGIAALARQSMDLPNTRSIGREPLPSIGIDESNRDVQECVDARGGSDARFSFYVGPSNEEKAPPPQERNSQQDRMSSALSAAGFARIHNRRMLQTHEGPQTSSSTDKAVEFDAVPDIEPDANPERELSASELALLYGVSRTIGIRGNQVLAGSLFVQERRPPESLVPGGERYDEVCVPEGLAMKLAAECDVSRVQAASAEMDFRDGKREPSGRTWIGVDPAFVTTSTLFNPGLTPDGWYNTTEGSAELNRKGVPHGFQSAPLGIKGLSDEDEDDIFPIMLDINAGNEQTRRVLTFMQEGNFFNRMATEGVKFKIATFNVDLQLFGYLVVDAEWDDAGLVEAFFDLQALESKDYTTSGLQMEGMRNRLANDMVLLAFVVLYVFLAARDIAKSGQAKHRRMRIWEELGGRHQHHKRTFKTLLQGTLGSLRRVKNNTHDAPNSGVSTWRAQQERQQQEAHQRKMAMALDSSLDILQDEWDEIKFDDTQINEHPIPKEQRRTIRLDQTSPHTPLGHQGRLARPSARSAASSHSSATSHSSDLAEPPTYHGMKRLVMQPLNRVYRGTMSPFWVLYEIITCLFLLCGLGLMLYYAFSLQPEEAPTERRIQIYDSFHAPARPFLLTRALHTPDGLTPRAGGNNATEGTDASDGGSAESDGHNATQGMRLSLLGANSSGTSDSVQAPSPFLREPGQSGRWLEGEEDTRGLVRTAHMFHNLDHMVSIKTAYTLIFAAAMVLLLVRLIVQASFQPRLSLIAGTLMLGIADILYFIFVLTVFGVMLSMALSVSLGPQIEELAEPSEAMLTIFQGIMMGGDQDLDTEKDLMPKLQKELMALIDTKDHAFDANLGTMAMAAMTISLRPLVSIFLFVMVMSILAKPFAMLKAGARSAPGVPQDVLTLLTWLWNISSRNEPDNRALKKLMKIILHDFKAAKSKRATFKELFKKSAVQPPKFGGPQDSTHDAMDLAALKHVQPRDLDSSKAPYKHKELDWSQLAALLHGELNEPPQLPGSVKGSRGTGSPYTRTSSTSPHMADVELGPVISGAEQLMMAKKVEQALTTGSLAGPGSRGGREGGHAWQRVWQRVWQGPGTEQGAAAGQTSLFKDIDFAAAKQQITALMASQRHEDKEAAKHIVQRMNMVFSAATASVSVKANLLSMASQRMPMTWLQRQNVLMRDMARNATTWLARGIPLRTHSGRQPASPLAGQHALPTSTILDEVSEQADCDSPVSTGIVSLELHSSSFKGLVLGPGSLPCSEVGVPCESNVSRQKMPALKLVEDLVNQTHRTTVALQEMRAACWECEKMACALQALLHKADAR